MLINANIDLVIKKNIRYFAYNNLISNVKILSKIVTHTLCWGVNFWIITMTNDYNWNGFTSKSGSLFYAYSYGLFFNAIVFYSQVFLLFPSLYLKKKKIYFYACSVGVILMSTVVETHIDSILYDTYEVTTNERENSFLFNLLFHIMYAIMGFFYVIRSDYKKTEKKREQLPDNFIRTHRSFVVSKTKIDKIKENTILIGAYSIPISTRLKKTVLNYFS